MSVSPDIKPELSHGGTEDVVFHYVDKTKIVESAVTGALVQALCGVVFPVTRSAKPGSPVCPQCKEMMELLRSFGSA
jgi:hypothetical protein